MEERKEREEVMKMVTEIQFPDGKGEGLAQAPENEEVVIDTPISESINPTDGIISKPEEEREESSSESNTEVPQDKGEQIEEGGETSKEGRQLLTKEVVVGKVAALLSQKKLTADIRKEIEFLKNTYFKLRRQETEARNHAATLSNEITGNDNQVSMPILLEAIDEHMTDLLDSYKKRKAEVLAEEEKLKEANYALCLQLLDQFKALIESHDDFEKRRLEYKVLLSRWKAARPLPPGSKTQELLQNYQKCSEDFYDLIKMNAEMRDYDFKKNLEAKTALCEAVERLIEEKDIRIAARQLQELHVQWREIGPVDQEHRESIRERFRTASTTVHRLHQAFFEERTLLEKARISVKVSLCETIEAIDTSTLKTGKEWEKKVEEINALREEWRASGAVEAKVSAKLYTRFRAACDAFFEQRIAYFHAIKVADETNIAKRRALCEQAEEIKESTDWKVTAEKCVALRKEWKEIPAPRRYRTAEILWRRFSSAIDYFFERRAKAFTEQRVTAETLRSIAKPRIANTPSELARRRSRLKNDILIYETNLSRFSVSSKGGNGIVQEIEKTIERLRNDLQQVENKIQAQEEQSETEQ
ncbi:MAG: DUF349 domain-containing protein [Tannerellaceae bacterium]|jgi:hypothetical protein|nr:DUF349 domain-containing protein [Tannerellaceae bacterium]